MFTVLIMQKISISFYHWLQYQNKVIYSFIPFMHININIERSQILFSHFLLYENIITARHFYINANAKVSLFAFLV